MIQTEHITKSFGRTRILSGISLHVRDRELVAYLGPNGAGKTTTVRILSGQARADGGTVKLAGRNLTEHPLEAKALCGVVSISIWMRNFQFGKIWTSTAGFSA